MAFQHDPINRADLVRQNDQHLTNRDRLQRDVSESAILFAMRHRGHAPRQRIQHRGGPANRIPLQRLAAGEHQDDEAAGQIFAEEYRRHDRDACEQVGTELALEHFAQQFPYEQSAAAN